MYKDMHNATTNDSELSERVYVKMEDVTESPVVESPQLKESIKSNIREIFDTSGHFNDTCVLRMSFQPHVPNRRYLDYMLLTNGSEPKDYTKACKTKDTRKQDLSNKDEIKSLISDQTWEIDKLHMKKKVLCKKEEEGVSSERWP